MARRVEVNDTMQKGYSYERVAPAGRDFGAGFEPELSPRELLHMGVFGGCYMTDCQDEFPKDWFKGAKLSPGRHDPDKNYFGINASQPLAEWRRKGWIFDNDPRGWFQWFCRYYSGRRIEGQDATQIGRWRAMRRHIGQVRKGCEHGDLSCRPKQRQALLHWAYDSRKI